MKLHEQTIARAERTYVNKAEAYFWGLAAGYLAGVITFTLLAVLMSCLTRGGK